MKKRKRPRKRPPKNLISGSVPKAWRDSFSIATILIFLSVLAFASQMPNSEMAGAILFFMGLMAFKHSRKLQKKGKSTEMEWVHMKIIQSLVLISVGVAMMLFLPDTFFGISLMIILVGFFWFSYYKFHYFQAGK